MIRLQFHSATSPRVATLGPAPYFRITGNFIRQGPDESVVAVYKNHSWEVHNEHFTRYVLQGKAAVHFEDLTGGVSDRFGPFDSFHMSDGVGYTSDHLFAKFMDVTQLWHCHPTDTFWASLVIEAADGGDE